MLLIPTQKIYTRVVGEEAVAAAPLNPSSRKHSAPSSNKNAREWDGFAKDSALGLDPDRFSDSNAF